MIKEEKQQPPLSTQQISVPWYYHSFFQYAIGILLVLTIILIFHKVAIFLKPLLDFISILFTPLVISFLFYYLLRPIVYFFERLKVPRTVTIFGVYILLVVGVILFVASIGPILTEQISALANTSVVTLEKLKENSRSMLLRLFNVNLDYEIEQRLFGIAQQVTTILTRNLVDFISFIARLATILAVIPFIVFYLLKSDHNFSSAFLRYIPEDFAQEIPKTLRNMDATLSNYITGWCSFPRVLGLYYLLVI